MDFRKALRDVLGGGADITPANPVQVWDPPPKQEDKSEEVDTWTPEKH